MKKEKSKVYIFVICALFLIEGALLAYTGGIKNAGEIAACILPVFGAGMIFLLLKNIIINFCLMFLMWLPEAFIFKAPENIVLFLPVVSLILAASSLERENFSKNRTVLAVALSSAVTLSAIIYNLTQYSLRSYFEGRWNKFFVFLILLGLMFLFLTKVKPKVNKFNDEKTILKLSKILCFAAVADIALGIETLLQYTYGSQQIINIYGFAWVMFIVVAATKFPQFENITERLSGNKIS